MIPARYRVSQQSSPYGVLAIFLCILGLGVFLFGLQAFRAPSSPVSPSQEEEMQSTGVAETTYDALPRTAVFVCNASDAQGYASRVFFADDRATLDISVTLPPLDAVMGTYDVWMVKQGLAEIVNLGSLSVRADGVWLGTFVLQPATGILEPALFSRVVLMYEPRDGNSSPSGLKQCEALFDVTE